MAYRELNRPAEQGNLLITWSRRTDSIHSLPLVTEGQPVLDSFNLQHKNL